MNNTRLKGCRFLKLYDRSLRIQLHAAIDRLENQRPPPAPDRPVEPFLAEVTPDRHRKVCRDVAVDRLRPDFSFGRRRKLQGKAATDRFKGERFGPARASHRCRNGTIYRVRLRVSDGTDPYTAIDGSCLDVTRERFHPYLAINGATSEADSEGNTDGKINLDIVIAYVVTSTLAWRAFVGPARIIAGIDRADGNAVGMLEHLDVDQTRITSATVFCGNHFYQAAGGGLRIDIAVYPL